MAVLDSFSAKWLKIWPSYKIYFPAPIFCERISKIF